jgi:putative restriction endonuclease
MTKAVLITKIGSIYDDLPEERYHFPRQYLRRMEACIRDWIVYYEPGRLSQESRKRDGRLSYFATARVDRIEADAAKADHYYAFVSQYLEFARPVPFKEGDHFYESKLRTPDGTANAGTAQNAVRHLPDAEYDLILQAGFANILGENAILSAGLLQELGEEEQEPLKRPIIERIVSRPFREAAFAGAVKSAYSETCAMTGLKIINGGGRSEVQAAHIRAVAADGPDSIRNGLALSGTVHWMFDRGLVSVDDDRTILVARDRVPNTVQRLLNPSGKLSVPDRQELRPNPRFMKFHREVVFKG